MSNLQETIQSYDWVAKRYSETLSYVVHKLETHPMEFTLQSELYKIMLMLTGGKSLLTKDLMKKELIHNENS